LFALLATFCFWRLTQIPAAGRRPPAMPSLLKQVRNLQADVDDARDDAARTSMSAIKQLLLAYSLLFISADC
jgi:hypothetical protein